MQFETGSLMTKRAIIFAFLTLLMACQGPTPPTEQENQELERLSAIASQVEIIRDDFGVPHIYGKTDADAVFGLLYAQAEDDFPRIERNYIWAMGRLAEIEGESALHSDLRARLYMTIDEAKAAYETADPQVKALCNAFANGLNYYLKTHPDVTPQLLTKFEPWMPMFFSEGSIGGDIEQIPLRGIAAFYGDGSTPPVPAKPEAMKAFTEPGGSNGFAIAGELTESGDAMLLINPHTSFYFRGEVHVVSEEGLNAYGAVTWGQFFVYQGFNEHNGWMHTSTYTDFMDEFAETVFMQDGKLVYQYGDEQRDVEVSDVTLSYKDGDGLSVRTFPTYHTHHGPITHIEDGKWTATKINWDPARALKQSFIRTKTTSLSEFNDMMDIRTNSSNNTVYADKDGNIAYYHGNFLPKRDDRFDYSKPVDGANPATDWQGLHEVSEIITISNPTNGWIQNANSTPFTAAAEFSPKSENYPKYMAPDVENFRGIHAQKVLTGSSGYTLDKLITAAYDPYLPAFEALIPGLISAYDGSNNRDESHAAAIDVLRDWDFTVRADSTAMSLAHFYGRTYLAEGERPDGLSQMQLITHFGKTSKPQERLAIFAKSVAQMNKDFGTWNTPWGEINRFQRLNRDIKSIFYDDKPSLAVPLASGTWGALAAYGQRGEVTTKKIYGTRGNSFVAVVEFGDKVKAKSLLAGGQSGDPNNPHFFDQAHMYTKAQFKDVPYYKDDVDSRSKEVYSPGQREK